MTTIIAALDNGPAGRTVARVAAEVATLFDAAPEALHVREDGTGMPRIAAADAGMPIDVVEGRVEDVLVDAAARPGVVALVMGTRRTTGGSTPAGSTAMEVVARASTPVVLVPPDLPSAWRLHRLLVPLEAEAQTAMAVAETVDQACACAMDVILLHVFEQGSMPPFTDQPQYEGESWIEEFLSRYCPEANGRVRVELRTGATPERILDVADEIRADLLVVAWGRDFSRTAAVVRAVLRRSPIPVLLLPIAADVGSGPGAMNARAMR